MEISIMKVKIRWKLVVLLFVVLFFVIAIIHFSFLRSTCGWYNEDSTKDAASFIEYCNSPDRPAEGLEGEVPTNGYDGYVLKSVYMVVRHGDRSALHAVPNLKAAWPFSCLFSSSLIHSVSGLYDYLHALKPNPHSREGKSYAGYRLFPNKAVCRKAELTPEGAAQHLRNGRFLREKYIQRHSLFTNEPIETQFLARGTTISRTFQSAVAFLHGFFPPASLNMTAVNFEMAENNSMCVQDCGCPVIDNDFGFDSFSSTYRQGDAVRRNPVNSIYHDLSLVLGTPIEALPSLSHVFDVGVTHYCHDIALNGVQQRGSWNNDCLNVSLIRRVHEAVDANGVKSLNDERFIRVVKIKMSPLLREIGTRMRDQTMGRAGDVKFVLYSGHDTTIDPLATALGIADGRWPRYAARIVFELYKQRGNDEHFVRLLQDGSVVTGISEFCSGHIGDHGLCPLKLFLDYVNGGLMKSIGERNYAEACVHFV